MAVINCKMCGSPLPLKFGATVVECEYCGREQTIPSMDNEKKLTLFARAERLRTACEFDKAAGVFESIVAEFPQEAEAYWGLVLCKYGIEYVDDPATGEKIPTCHRSSFDSVFDDPDYEQVYDNADVVSRKVYRTEAKRIEDIRRSVVAVSNNEVPYDIFICYKETAENGDRTLDSVLAQDIYDALTAKGYRVFFARITLEDKLGQEYEPYIFAALNSAKIMLAVGTEFEHYNAVWVKNEWSRYLKLMTKDKDKHLIPCFKGLDAYDMPKEFARLQAQNLGKVGAMQDLLRGIEKLLPRKKETVKEIIKEQVVVQQTDDNQAQAMLQRGNMALEDEQWGKAKEFFEEVLNRNAACAEAYLGLAMCERKVNTIEDLVECRAWNVTNYRRGKQFAKGALLQKLESLEQNCMERERQAEATRKKAEDEAATRLKPVRECIRPVARYISASTFNTAVLKLDGTVLAKGFNLHNECEVEDWRSIVAISSGREHTVGLKADGSCVAMGTNSCGQCDVQEWTTIIAVSAGRDHTVGLRADGTVVATKYTGNYYFSQCDVDQWRDIVAVSAGEHHTVGLKADGTVVAVGLDLQGQCKVGDWKNIVAVSAGDDHTIGLKADGTVVATKFEGAPTNYRGQCGVSEWKDIVAISAGNDHTVGLKADGTVVATEYKGEWNRGQCNVSSWKDIVAIAAANYHTVGLRSDGVVVTTVCNADNVSFCEVAGVRIFNSIQTIWQESAAAWQARRQMEEEERVKAQRRCAGLCQYCGSEFKGLFAKKCANCGRPKDY